VFWALVAILAIAGYLRLAFTGAELLYASVPVAADPVVPQIQAMALLVGVGLSAVAFVPIGIAYRRQARRMWLALLWPAGYFLIPLGSSILGWLILGLIYGGVGMGLVFSRKPKPSETSSVA
jgi:hypothetical protein